LDAAPNNPASSTQKIVPFFTYVSPEDFITSVAPCKIKGPAGTLYTDEVREVPSPPKALCSEPVVVNVRVKPVPEQAPSRGGHASTRVEGRPCRAARSIPA